MEHRGPSPKGGIVFKITIQISHVKGSPSVCKRKRLIVEDLLVTMLLNQF